MLLVNLKERTEKPQRRLSPAVQFSMLGLLLAGLVFPRHSAVLAHAPETRPLAIEEQEVVFSALDRVNDAKLTHALVSESLSAVVDPSAKFLVREKDQSLIFSSRFFDADTVAQESSLLKVLGQLNPSAPPTGEIAILDK